jgi:hypothetical protein
VRIICKLIVIAGGAAEQVPGLLPGAGQDPLQRPQAADPAGQVRPRIQGARHTHAGPRLGIPAGVLRHSTTVQNLHVEGFLVLFRAVVGLALKFMFSWNP